MQHFEAWRIDAIRKLTRAYIEYAYWSAGKVSALGLYNRYVGRREHSATVQTRWGDKLDVTLPDLISGVISATGQWEPAVTHYVRTKLHSGDTFVDVGANIGYFTLLGSRLVGPAGHVYAIEASPSIYSRLSHNVELNHRSNVTAINAAASDHDGESPIYLDSAGNFGHSTTVEGLASASGMQREASVRSGTLDQLIGDDALRHANLIKVDVEGGEYAVLSPLLSSLSEFSDCTEWLVELSPKHCPGGQPEVDRVYGCFMDAGYGGFAVANAYNAEHFVSSGAQFPLCALDGAPRKQCDILFRRRH
jgi:FkbM family methyltransferase